MSVCVDVCIRSLSLFNNTTKCLLSMYYAPDTVLGAWDTSASKAKVLLREAYIQ